MEDLFNNNYDKEKFLNFCEECKNFGKRYSCPPFHNMDDYLKPFEYVNLIAAQITYSEEEIKKYKGDLMFDYISETYIPVKNQMKKVLLELEKLYDNTISLGFGACDYCDECNILIDKPCRHKDKMRYSPEALGFDITSILKDYFDIDICWAKDSLPEYYTLLAGLCSKDDISVANEIVVDLFEKL